MEDRELELREIVQYAESEQDFAELLLEWFCRGTLLERGPAKPKNYGSGKHVLLADEEDRKASEALAKAISDTYIYAFNTPPVVDPKTNAVVTPGRHQLVGYLLAGVFTEILKNSSFGTKAGATSPFWGMEKFSAHPDQTIRRYAHILTALAGKREWTGEMLARLMAFLAAKVERVYMLTPQDALRSDYGTFIEKLVSEVGKTKKRSEQVFALWRDKQLARLRNRKMDLMKISGPLKSNNEYAGFHGVFRHREGGTLPLPKSLSDQLYEFTSFAIFDVFSRKARATNDPILMRLSREAVRDYLDGDGGEDLAGWLVREIEDEFLAYLVESPDPQKRMYADMIRHPHSAALKTGHAIGFQDWPPEVQSLMVNTTDWVKGKGFKRRWNPQRMVEFIRATPATIEDFEAFLRSYDVRGQATLATSSPWFMQKYDDPKQVERGKGQARLDYISDVQNKLKPGTTRSQRLVASVEPEAVERMVVEQTQLSPGDKLRAFFG